jgi:hypothetical protein
MADLITVSAPGTIPTPVAPNQPNILDILPADALDTPGTVLTFQVLVTDSAGQTATAQTTVTIVGTPTVSLNPPQTVLVKTPFTLTANGSSPNGAITTYAWTLLPKSP